MSSHEPLHHAEHLSQSSELWKKRAVIVSAVFAVMIALASFGAENANHHSLLLKDESIDQWNYFQAKALKQRLYEFEERNLSFTSSKDSMFQEKAKLAEQLQNEVERYEQEQANIEKQANQLSEESEHANKKGNYFELAQVFFELGIVLIAVFLLSEMFWILWGIGIIGGIGILFLGLGTFF